MNSHNLDESYQESQFRWRLLLLAIIINIALLLFLFLMTIDNDLLHFPKQENSAPVVFQDMQEPPQPPPPQLKSDEIAALIPGASNFGIPDELKEDEMIARIAQENIEWESTHQEKIDEQEIVKKEEPSQQPELIQMQQATTIPEIKHQEKPKSQEPVQKEIKKVEPQPQQEKIRAPLKKELTFNDIAKGFLSSLDKGGNDMMERKGNENIRPDFEEMRYLSYVHKIGWYMQNEWLRDTTVGQCGAPTFPVTAISVTIDKEGVLKRAVVVQSCGNHSLDEAILRGIHAASPYPPLPAYLKKDEITIDFGVKHVARTQNRFNCNFT